MLGKKVTKEKTLIIKVRQKDFELIKEKATRYTAGNVSAWVRYAARNLEPLPEDLEDAPSN